MALTPKTNIVTEGQARLISQFKRQPNMLALLGTYLEQIQDIEDAAFSMLAVAQSPGTQTGDPLDLIGKIVGQDREGRTDTVLQKWILARLIVNRSSGLVDEILTALGLIAPDNLASLEEYFPASFVVRLADAFSGDAAAAADIVREIRAAGVGASLEYWTTDPMFVFASGDLEESSLQGFTEVSLEETFDSWTGDDPDGWGVYETPPNTEISEVGSGETHGGAGTGACNFYFASGFSANILRTVNVLAGIEHTCTVEISQISGSLRVYDVSGDFDESFTSAGAHTITWTPDGATITLRCTVLAAADATVDSITVAVSAGAFAACEEI